MGLLKILSGKPGTLDSPGHILSLDPGRPAGPKRRFSHFEEWSRTAAGWGCGCVPTDPAGRVCLSYQARVGPSHNTHVGPALNPLALPLFTYYFTQVPYAYYYAPSWRSRIGQGARCWLAHLVLALHPTGSYCAESPALPPCTERGSTLNRLSLTSFCDCFIVYIVFMPPDLCCWLATF